MEEAHMCTEEHTDVEYFDAAGWRGLPFSEAVRVGNMLYVSGQLGLDQSRKLVSGGIAEETGQALENISAILTRHGSSLEHIVKVTVMMADMGEWGAMNKVYMTYFPKHLPARSAFGTTGLAMGGRVEIECLAVLK
jgi:2-iminobutanoate/2-iminopropanoate deaminase